MIYTFYTSSYSQSIYMFGNKSFRTGTTNASGTPLVAIPEEYIPYVKQHGAGIWTKAILNNALNKNYINKQEYDDTVALMPLPIPAAPVVTVDDENNIVSGITTAMEYAIDEAVDYTVYTEATSPYLVGDHVIRVRLTRVPFVTASSLDTTLTFTVNPVKPMAPSVYMDDSEDMVIGINSAMEYSYNDVDYTKYVEGAIIGLYGNITIHVRISAEGINPPSDAVELPFTLNPITPIAPLLTLDDVNNTISGMTTLMEFSVNDSSYILYNNTIFNMINFNGDYTFKGRVKARGSNPCSVDTVLQITLNQTAITPEAPSIIIDDTLNTITGIDSTMEYNFDDMGYLNYVAEEFDTIDFTGEHILLVRVSAEGVNPAGETTTLTFTV